MNVSMTRVGLLASFTLSSLLVACGPSAQPSAAPHTHLEDPITPIGSPAPSGDSRDGVLILAPAEPMEGALAAAVAFFQAIIDGDRHRLDAALEDELLRVNPRATSYTRSKPSLLGVLLHPSRRAHLGEAQTLRRLVDLERVRSLPLSALYLETLPPQLGSLDRAVEIHLTPEGVRAFRGSLPGAAEKFIILVRGAPPHRIVGL